MILVFNPHYRMQISAVLPLLTYESLMYKLTSSCRLVRLSFQLSPKKLRSEKRQKFCVKFIKKKCEWLLVDIKFGFVSALQYIMSTYLFNQLLHYFITRSFSIFLILHVRSIGGTLEYVNFLERIKDLG